MARNFAAIFVFYISLFKEAKLLNNGLALTPPMGWMSWGYYQCAYKCVNSSNCLNEELILSVADKFHKEGYLEAGFEYIIIDDCWSEPERDSSGRLVADKKRFPRGMKYIADYIHDRGLKFGMYTNIGPTTCMGFPGSSGYYNTDAKTFANWDIDYLKVDGCFVSEHILNYAYVKLGRQLNITGRPIVYSCSWPYYIEFIIGQKPDLEKVSKYCNLWRNFHDVVLSWPAVREIILYYERLYDSMSIYHGPGSWNDPDMLVFGTGVLTPSQSRVQITVYAMMSAPLLLSCDMNKITEYEKKLLQNLNLMSIAKDPIGKMAEPYKIESSLTIWVKTHHPMKGDRHHSYSFGIVNLGHTAASVTFQPSTYGLRSQDPYTMMDVLKDKILKNITKDDLIHVTVPPEDVVLYTLYPL